MHPTQAAYTARALRLAALEAAHAQAAQALPFPVDYDANDQAAAAYEDAVEAAAARLGLHQAREALRAAEDALLDWALSTVAADPAYGPIAATIDRARHLLAPRARLLSLAARLAP